uniref:Photosystem II reaction center protein Z n=1 Tax=Colacium vesiculosum TaxID=102910 RepID=J3JR56_9EUGL|nr:photosystem II protein Z [Colacium vesiculosum]
MNSILLVFQASLLALILFSLVLIIVVPVTLAAPNGWDNNKNYILLGGVIWLNLVILIGILNFYVV